MATLFAGALYVCDIDNNLKAISFVFIVIVNVIFSLNWLLSIINVVFHAHIKKFQEYFPNLTYSIVAGILTLEKTKKTLNCFHYFREVKKNFRKIRTSIQTFDSNERSQINMNESKGMVLKKTLIENKKISKFKPSRAFITEIVKEKE